MLQSVLDLRLLNDYQRDFPLAKRPFGVIARQLQVSEREVLAALRRLQIDGKVSRVGAVFRPNRIGASTLAALAAPQDRLEQIAALISAHPEVNHNYQREHHFNLWFVVAANSPSQVQAVLRDIELQSGCEVLYLPLLEEFHIDLGFDLTGRGGHLGSRDGGGVAHSAFTPNAAVIDAIQDGIPLVSRPFAEVGRAAGLSEVEALAELRAMIENDVIKRFGIVVRHHELGYRANAMAVWDVPEERIADLGRCISRYPFITLCYRRARQLPAWRYNLYCMIHGKDRESVVAHLTQLRQECGLDEFAHELLFSTRRFKQCGARYGRTEEPRTTARSA